LNHVLAILGAVFIRGLFATLRVRHARSGGVDALNAVHRNFIITFWHEHLLMMLHSRYRKPITVMSSRSRDGELAVRVYHWYGVETIRGSSSKGAAAALRGLIRKARDGRTIVFTPDGPRGPARQAKEGIVLAAQVTGLEVVPIAFAAARKKRLRSWDRMIVPMPFTRALFLYGEPLAIPRDGDAESWRARVEQELNALADEAEQNLDELWRGGQRHRRRVAA
jgi:lysophospholipid acyltransferase (LPLAT)-like uncharacterized protein